MCIVPFWNTSNILTFKLYKNNISQNIHIHSIIAYHYHFNGMLAYENRRLPVHQYLGTAATVASSAKLELATIFCETAISATSASISDVTVPYLWSLRMMFSFHNLFVLPVFALMILTVMIAI